MYLLEHGDMRRSSACTYGVPRWNRTMIWGRTTVRYERTVGIPIAVTEDQHAFLMATLKSVSTIVHQVLDVAFKEWQTGKDDWWPEQFPVGFMNGLTKTMLAAGIVRGTTAWHARERAAVHAIDLMKTRLRTKQYPKLPLSGGSDDPQPAALSLRLAAGLQYDAPLWWREDGCLRLGDLGYVYGPKDLRGQLPGVLEECRYVELAQWECTWHARFVFSRDVTDAERAATKLKKEKKS